MQSFYIWLTAFTLTLPLAAAEGTKAGADSGPLDEISDNSGRITRGKVIRVTDKEVVYSDAFGTERTLKTENLIFVRSATGEYRFFFPDETPAARPAEAESSQFLITGGLATHFADNGASAVYAVDYGKALAAKYNQQGSTGYEASLSRNAAANQWQFFLEPRLQWENWIVGLNLGYAALPKTGAVVSSPTTSGQITINVSGMMFPLTVMFYYRVFKTKNMGINLGAGAGVLYSAISVNQNGGVGAGEQVYTGANPMLALKPEFTYQLGPIQVLLSVPFYWAESRDLSDGETTLNKINSTNVLSPNLTGLAVAIAAGYKL